MNTEIKNTIEIFETADALSHAAAERIVFLADKYINARGKFSLVISGGSTPQKLFKLLGSEQYKNKFDWKNIFIFWGDERFLPLTDSQNNAHQAKILWLDKVPIPKENIFTIPTQLSPMETAKKYEGSIKHFFGPEPAYFDLILLGLGENGHVASLFPKTEVLNEKRAGIRALYIKEVNMYRVTFTTALINQAHHILFLVSGKSKAEIVKKVLIVSEENGKYPAQMIQPLNGELQWYLDKDAASEIAN